MTVAPVEQRLARQGASPGDRALLSVERVSYEVGGVRVLTDVSFALARGELVAVMGPSGSGKTTLLKCLNRLLEPSGGRIILDGRDTGSMSPVELRRRVGMVWQAPLMFAGTVSANLSRAVELSGSGVEEGAFAALLRRVAFDGGLDVDARHLSVGEQQRVSIARALACQPALLLCDEPTAALDHDNALRLEATFRELCADGMTVVWVTHEAAQAERIADRTLLLAGGAVRDAGAS